MRRFVELLTVAIAMQTGAQHPTFKSGTDAIWISATVIGQDGHLVTDLSKEDFEVRVDGEVRPVTSFRSDRIPYAIVSMFDLSGSMYDNLPTMRRAMREIVDRFEPGDRANIGTFGSVPYLSPRFSGNAETLLSWVTATIGGSAVPCKGDFLAGDLNLQARLQAPDMTAIYDAVDCAIDTVAADAETPRRVVLLVSDGMDNVSTRTPAQTIIQANQYGVMVYAILMNGNDPGGINRGALLSLSEQTGGGFFVLNNHDDLPATFARVSEELRHQYVFGITAAADDKKHTFEVKALRPGSTTRAHRVYMAANPLITHVEPVGPPPLAAPGASFALPSVALDAPSPIDLVPALDRFERGDWSAAGGRAMSPDQLQALSKALHERGPAWIAARGATDERRRRLALATFVLQMLYGQEDPFVWQGGGELFKYHAPLPAAALVDWTSEMLKHEAPLPAERWWHLGAIALLERAKATEMLNLEIDRARARFPTEDRWTLARAISQEFGTWPEPRDDHSFSITPLFARELTEKYQDALVRESVRAEAELRLGYFDLRRGRADEAHKHFQKAGTPADSMVRYWLGLFQGQAFEQMKQWPQAVDAYRRAFNAAPYAQSAALALAAALEQAHRPEEAAGVVARTLSLRPVPFDPWAIYTLPDMRFWPRITTELHAAIVVKQ